MGWSALVPVRNGKQDASERFCFSSLNYSETSISCPSKQKMASLLRSRNALQTAARTSVPSSSRRLATATSSFDPAVYPQNLIPPYAKLIANLEVVKKRLGRPLTLAEKIVYSHLADPTQEIERGQSYLKLKPGGLLTKQKSRIWTFPHSRLRLASRRPGGNAGRFSPNGSSSIHAHWNEDDRSSLLYSLRPFD